MNSLRELSQLSDQTTNPNYNNAAFPTLVRRFGELADQSTLSIVIMEAVKRIYRSANLGNYEKDRATENGVENITAIAVAIGSIISNNIIKYLGNVFQNIKNHTKALQEVKATKDELKLDIAKIEEEEEEFYYSGPSM